MAKKSAWLCAVARPSARARQRFGRAPHHHLHAERAAVASHQPANAAVAPNAQRAPMQDRAQAEIGRHRRRLQPRLLPGAVLQVAHVLGQPARRRHDERPRQFGRRDRRTHALGHGDAALGAGRDIKVRADAPGLRNHLQPWQLFDQRARDLRAFADQHDHFGIAQPYRQLAQTLDRVGVDLGRIGLELGRARQLANGVLIVVEDHDIHAPHCARGQGG